MNHKEQQLIESVLGDEIINPLINDLGLSGATTEQKAEMISQLGANIFDRLVLEILKEIPATEHAALQVFIGSGDIEGLKKFLTPHIADIDHFLRVHAIKELESTKTRAQHILQGVDN